MQEEQYKKVKGCEITDWCTVEGGKNIDSPTERIITLRITSERITSERINTERITS
jgi:hypothetical protein